jgi:hypothetical protein
LKSNSLGIESAADTCSTENVVKTQPKFYKEKKTLFIFTKYKICFKTGIKPSGLIFFPGPNILVDDTLPSEVDKGLLGSVKDSIVQGTIHILRKHM